MKRYAIVVWFLFFFAASALAAELANVNGKSITTEDLQKILDEMPPQERTQYDSLESRADLLENLITRELLFQEGKRQGLEKEKEIISQIEDAKRDILVNAVVEKIRKTRLGEQEMRLYYEEHRDDFREIRASHILVETEKEAKDLRKKLDAGSDFGELARKHSIDSNSGQQGGDLGYFTRNTMVKAFEDVAFSMKVNQVSEPVKTQFGFHIIKMVEGRDPRVFEEITQPVKQSLRRTIFRKEVEKLKTAAKIRVHKERLMKE